MTNLYEAGDINTVDGDEQADINSSDVNASDINASDDLGHDDEGNEPNEAFDGGTPLAVLSYGYWRARFGADRGIVGKQIVVNGRALTIVGVSAAGFDGVEPGRAPQIRIPMTMKDDLPRTAYFDRLNNDRFRWAEVFGRLKPGMAMEKAQAGLQPLFHQILNREVTEKPFAKA